MTKRQECGILYMSAAECRWPTIALPEMTGFYNKLRIFPLSGQAIALPEMTGFYNSENLCQFPHSTIALPETAGLWYIRTKKGPQDYALRLHNKKRP